MIDYCESEDFDSKIFKQMTVKYINDYKKLDVGGQGELSHQILQRNRNNG